MKKYLFYLSVIAVFSACNKLDPPTPSAGDADLSTIAAVGGSYMAGYSNGALYEDAQQYSIPALIAAQMKLAGGGDFNQPLVHDAEGLGLNIRPWDSDFHSKSILGDRTDCKNEVSFGPVKQLFNATETALLSKSNGTINNLAVPYGELKDLNRKDFGLPFPTSKNPYFNRFATNAGAKSVLEQLDELNPTFIISDIGMQTIYNYAFSGATSTEIPSPEQLGLDSLFNEWNKKGIQVVIATIPEIEFFPYFNLIPNDGANLSQEQADSLNDVIESAGEEWNHLHFIKGDNRFIIEDALAPQGYRHMKAGENVLFSTPLDSIKCSFMGLLVQELPDIHALDSAELSIINTAINEYNTFLRSKANEYGFALAEVNELFKEVENGKLWNGVNFNLGFVSGGFISLDGFHPTTKGNAIIANEYITAINTTYNASLPQLTCEDCVGTLFPAE